MCWYSQKQPDYKVADKGIVVYKRFCQDDMVYVEHKLASVYSLVYGYNYAINQLNKPIELWHYNNNGFYDIYEGYHSWLTRKPPVGITLPTFGKIIKIVKCVIPKGSTYAKNEIGEVVSSNIIVTDEIIDRFIVTDKIKICQALSSVL